MKIWYLTISNEFFGMSAVFLFLDEPIFWWEVFLFYGNYIWAYVSLRVREIKISKWGWFWVGVETSFYGENKWKTI